MHTEAEGQWSVWSSSQNKLQGPQAQKMCTIGISFGECARANVFCVKQNKYLLDKVVKQHNGLIMHHSKRICLEIIIHLNAASLFFWFCVNTDHASSNQGTTWSLRGATGVHKRVQLSPLCSNIFFQPIPSNYPGVFRVGLWDVLKETDSKCGVATAIFRVKSWEFGSEFVILRCAFLDPRSPVSVCVLVMLWRTQISITEKVCKNWPTLWHHITAISFFRKDVQNILSPRIAWACYSHGDFETHSIICYVRAKLGWPFLWFQKFLSRSDLKIKNFNIVNECVLLCWLLLEVKCKSVFKAVIGTSM